MSDSMFMAHSPAPATSASSSSSPSPSSAQPLTMVDSTSFSTTSKAPRISNPAASKIPVATDGIRGSDQAGASPPKTTLSSPRIFTSTNDAQKPPGRRRRRRRYSDSSTGSLGFVVRSEHVGMDISEPDGLEDNDVDGGSTSDVMLEDDRNEDQCDKNDDGEGIPSLSLPSHPIVVLPPSSTSTTPSPDRPGYDIELLDKSTDHHQQQEEQQQQQQQQDPQPQHINIHKAPYPSREVTDDSEASEGSTKANRQQQSRTSESTSTSVPQRRPQNEENTTQLGVDDSNGAVLHDAGEGDLSMESSRDVDEMDQKSDPHSSSTQRRTGGAHTTDPNQDDSSEEGNVHPSSASDPGPTGRQRERQDQQSVASLPARPSQQEETSGNKRRVQWESPEGQIVNGPPSNEVSSSKRPLEHQDSKSEVNEGEGSHHRKKHQTPFPPLPPAVEPLDISYTSTPATLRLKDELLSRLSLTAPMGKIQVIDLSRRGLTEKDADLISATMRGNPQLAVLKLGYNSLGDKGAAILASSASTNGRHHQNLTVLDLGFNDIGDDGCIALSTKMLTGNHTLRNLFLSGNHITEKGASALAGAILHGCSLSRLHLSANKLGTEGVKVLAQAVSEAETRVQQLLQRQGGIKLGYTIKPVTMEELHLSDVGFDSDGFATISSMVMTNFNLTTLALANNNIDDKDMALLSQGLAQNKAMPITSLVLSFNRISCAGVECLMNAVWGSPTLKEIKLDNNNMKDRGAQLCSVVLGSIRLEILDVSFNLISTVGIKAIMKSLSENNSLQRLGLSGIPVDQNASKAVSYALAYNQSLLGLNVDSCNIGYSGQRHIVAGVVSNRNVKLRILTGFPLGPITVTLGLPQLPEDWGNDRVLSFVRFMWAQWRAVNVNGTEISKELSRGPAPPSMVASSAKTAFGSLSQSDEAKLLFQSEHQSLVDECPLVAPDTSILVRSASGKNLQVPSWDVQLQEATVEANEEHNDNDSWSSETDSFDRSSYTGSSQSLLNVAAVDHERRNKNLVWLRSHLQSLNEVGNLDFNNADLWQLHQYFYSPAYSADDELEIDNTETADDEADESTLTKDKSGGKAKAPPPTPAPLESGKAGIGRAISFQTLGRAVAKAAADEAKRPNKRGSLEEDQPLAKRPKHLKPRIAFYPRIQEKLESLGTKPSVQTLSLLRRLKYVESVMLSGKDIYSDHEPEDDGFRAPDAEMVLLDLL